MPLLEDIRVPQISRDELFAFHESHFCKVSVADFGVSFTGLQVPPKPVPTDGPGQVDDNGGDDEYDGEYVAADDLDDDYDYDEPFDPSVAHLVPDFDIVEAAKEATDQQKDKDEGRGDEEAEDGEIPDDEGTGQAGDGLKPKKKKKRRRKKIHNTASTKGAGSNINDMSNDISNAASSGSNEASAQKRPDGQDRQQGRRQKQPQKPDLRKRTWDVVDKGLGSLDYGDADADLGSMPAPSQRRRIQYED